MSGESNKTQSVEFKGQQFVIEKDIEMPSLNEGQGSKAATEAMGRNKGKSDISRTHNEGGTFEIYCDVKLRSSNYQRNGIYIIIEA